MDTYGRVYQVYGVGCDTETCYQVMLEKIERQQITDCCGKSFTEDFFKDMESEYAEFKKNSEVDCPDCMTETDGCRIYIGDTGEYFERFEDDSYISPDCGEYAFGLCYWSREGGYPLGRKLSEDILARPGYFVEFEKMMMEIFDEEPYEFFVSY